MNDPVYHPEHYTGHPSGVECVEITEHMNFCLGNAIKYIWRAGQKADTIQDLEKALWYINREIDRLEQYGPTTVPECTPDRDVTQPGPDGPGPSSLEETATAQNLWWRNRTAWEDLPDWFKGATGKAVKECLDEALEKVVAAKKVARETASTEIKPGTAIEFPFTVDGTDFVVRVRNDAGQIFQYTYEVTPDGPELIGRKVFEEKGK